MRPFLISNHIMFRQIINRAFKYPRRLLKPNTMVRIVGDHPYSGRDGVINGVKRIPGGGRRLYRVLVGKDISTLVPQSWVRI